MKRLAESYLGRSISKAIIAAPIYFNDAQKKELELAGKLAGLDVLGIVDEPLVATLASKNIDGGILQFSLWVVEHSISQSLRSPMELSRSKEAVMSLDSTALGIETLGEDLQGLLTARMIPCMASRNITTPLDYPNSLSIRTLQGEHQIASRNDLLGELKVTGIPRAPCGVVSIKLDFCVDKKGFLTVLAKSKDTDFEWSMEMNYLDKLCENYVRMMAKKAMLSGKMNVEKSALMQLKSVVEFKINRIEKMLNFCKKQIPRVYLGKYEMDLCHITFLVT
ncbi:hypothetical protein LOK49_LG11G00012 [Camellia lanceoleosa]|uniref:Uncharacterized protein n=1 Tax=Camellia lanceoleosa TaxID=1840588 RepID=A0ACC0G4M6_9ERIC|nr:hypothetical protein LOK49_LG11G00012 [Camellia lanceoleosa]